jgi:hypothetical protein
MWPLVDHVPSQLVANSFTAPLVTYHIKYNRHKAEMFAFNKFATTLMKHITCLRMWGLFSRVIWHKSVSDNSCTSILQFFLKVPSKWPMACTCDLCSVPVDAHVRYRFTLHKSLWLLMLILLLGLWTVWMWAMLPTFQSSVVSPFSWSEWSFSYYWSCVVCIISYIRKNPSYCSCSFHQKNKYFHQWNCR